MLCILRRFLPCRRIDLDDIDAASHRLFEIARQASICGTEL